MMMRKNNIKYTISVLALCLFSYSVKAEEISTNAALMQAMDKVTGRVNKVTVPVNSKVNYGDFSLVLRACKKRPAEETPENFAFVDVTDKSFGEDEYNIFRGWLLSSTPGINAIEHPIYDMWLLECVDVDTKTVPLLTEEELNARDKLPSKKAIMVAEENSLEENSDNIQIPEKEKNAQVIHIKEFINEDRDIEKNVNETPAYISESSTSYVSDIEEGNEPENLLLFTKMQEVEQIDNAKKEENPESDSDELTKALEAEINSLQQN